jgi:hypothetical protein
MHQDAVLAMTVFLFSLVFGAMVYFVFRPKTTRDLGWECLPVLLLLVLFAWGCAIHVQ